MKAIVAGTFDPFTAGHRDIVERALRLYGSVVIAVAVDAGKSASPLEDRLEIARLSVADLAGVKVVGFGGLLSSFLKLESPCVLVRGLRGVRDYEYERDLGRVYASQCDTECIYLISAPQYEHVSSTTVRQLAGLGGDLDGYIVPAAADKIAALFGNKAKE